MTAHTGKYFTKMPFGPNFVNGYWNKYQHLKDGVDEGGMPSGYIVDKAGTTFSEISVFVNGKEEKALS